MTPVGRRLCQTDVAAEVLLADMWALKLVEAVCSKHSAVVGVDRSDVKERGGSIHYEACSFDYCARPVSELDIPPDEEGEAVEECCLDGTYRATEAAAVGSLAEGGCGLYLPDAVVGRGGSAGLGSSCWGCPPRPWLLYFTPHCDVSYCGCCEG